MILELLDREYAVYRFNVRHKIDQNLLDTDFVSITKTEDEISIVAASGTLEDFDKKEDGWKILKIKDMLDFSLIGVISRISTLLANERISIFVISTYNTDYIMIKKEKVKEAIELLKKNTYEIKEHL